MDQRSIGRRPIISRFARQGYFRAKTCRAKLFLSNGILIAFSVSLNHKSTFCRLFSTLKNLVEMKNADKPFIGILIITIAILYGVIAMLS